MPSYPFRSERYNNGNLVGVTTGSIPSGSVVEGVVSDSGRVVVKTEEVPNFKALVESGGLLPHTEHWVYNDKVVYTFSQMSGRVQLITGDPTCSLYYFLNSGYHAVRDSTKSFALAVPPAVDHNPLVIGAVAEAQQGILDLATSIAELPETVQFFKDGVEAVRNRLQALKPKALRSAVKRWRRMMDAGTRPSLSAAIAVASEEVSAAWLAYRYGLMPIVYASEDLKEAYEYLGRGERFYDIVEGKRSTHVSANSSPAVAGTWSYSGTPPGHGGPGFTSRNECRVDRHVRASAQCQLQRSFHAMHVSPITFWELVPFSFVIDWFTNISDHILAYYTPPTATTVCSYSVKDVYESVHVHSWYASSCGCVYTDLVGKRTREEYHRIPAELPSMDLGTLTFSGAERLNLARLADSAALLRQLVPSLIREIANALTRLIR